MIAAARIGYDVVGIDPGIDAILAARRVAEKFGVEADFIVADARYLPFADDVFDTAFSHSVLPSFSKDNVTLALEEVSRVLKPSGSSMLQMPNKYGLRQYQQRRRRGFTEGDAFETRYWSPAELIETFEQRIGPTKLTADCFFGLGIQFADIDLLPAKYKTVVYSSEILRRLSTIFTPLTKVADSVYLESVNRKN
jgi:ubiquinone/menaquinone biosynthesis C-methylase UbiE